MVDPSIRPGNLNLVRSQGLRVPTEIQSPRRRREGFLDGIRLKRLHQKRQHCVAYGCSCRAPMAVQSEGKTPFRVAPSALRNEIPWGRCRSCASRKPFCAVARRRLEVAAPLQAVSEDNRVNGQLDVGPTR
jgi:hypothetical protein